MASRITTLAAGCVCWLLALAPLLAAEDLAYDLAKVKGIEYYRGPDSGRALLSRNGFVVVPHYSHRIFAPYFEENLPHYVTTDSVHQTFHTIFEDEIKNMETAFAAEVAALSRDMLAQVRELRSNAGGLSAPEAGAADLAEAYFAVATTLIADKPDALPDPASPAAQELRLIDAAKGIAVSPGFGYKLDYSQFKPRGFYTETPVLQRLFRTMSWYGNAAFRLESDRETRAALRIAQAYAQCPPAQERWRKLDRVYTYFIGRCDDLTPDEYATVLKRLADLKLPDLIASFRVEAASLRNPTVNSMVLDPGQMQDWPAHTKGLRFFGNRALPDSQALVELTDPKVPGRAFPCGLDVLTANGSKRAAELAAARPDSRMPGYAEGMARARVLLDAVKADSAPTQYAEFLRLADSVTAPPLEKAPPFARTTAYADKNQMTALAMWASMRHAWVLQAKQSFAALCCHDEKKIPGYVELNPEFFRRMRIVLQGTIAALRNAEGADIKRLEAFDTLVRQLTTVVDKERKGDPFTPEEVKLLEEYGYHLSALQGFPSNYNADGTMPWMALIADVHSERQSGKCLEVGTGGGMPMYLIIEYDGVPQLLIGGVYSYCEFQQPISARLTDEEWRGMWASGHMPALPAWTASFMPGFDAAAVIARIRNGELVEEAPFVNTPELDAFLERALRPDGALAGKVNYCWAFRLAAQRLGHRMAPVLLEALGHPEFWAMAEKAYMGDSRNTAEVVIPSIIEDHDIPALVKIALGEDGDAAWFVQLVVEQNPPVYETGIPTQAARAKMIERLAVALFEAAAKKGKSALSRVNIAMWVNWYASKDMTPALLTLWRRYPDSADKSQAVAALADIWRNAPAEPGHGPRLPTTATPEDLARWEAEMRRMTLSTLKAGDDYAADDAAELAAVLHMPEAVPHIAKCAAANNSSGKAVTALVMIGTDAAIAALANLPLPRVDGKSGAAAEYVRTLGQTRSPRAVARLRALLTNTADAGSARVCDLAAHALSLAIPPGPGFDICAFVEQRDVKIKEWQEYLGKQPAPGGGP